MKTVNPAKMQDYLSQLIASNGNLSQYQTIPLTAPGIANPGPDFLKLAQMLSPDEPIAIRNCLQGLYDTALYQDWLSLNVVIKGQLKSVRIIPGHLWGDSKATGPTAQARVMLIGKIPNLDDTRVGLNFSGKAGEILEGALKLAGAEGLGDWYVTSLIKFANPAPQLGNTIPTDWPKDCRPLLQMEMRLVKPDFILCLGSEAGKELLGLQGTVTNSTGKVFDYEFILPDGEIHKCKVMTCIHPNAVKATPDLLPQLNSSVGLFTRLVNGEKIGIDETDIQHIVVRTEEDAIKWLNLIIEETKTGGAIAVDCEWEGEYPQEAGSWLRTIQISHKSKFALCVVLHKCGGDKELIDSKIVKELINKVFEQTNIRKIRGVGHFHRADLPWLLHYGVDLRKQFEVPAEEADGWLRTKDEGGFDTGTAAHAVCETDDYKLEVLATRYTSAPRYDMALQKAKKELCKQMKIKAKELTGYGNIPDDVLLFYSLYDVDTTRRLFDVFNGIDNKPGLLDCDEFKNNSRLPFWISMRASAACAEMEAVGLTIDMEKAEQLLNIFRVTEARKYAELKEKIKWPTFNLNSSFDCRELLYGRDYRRQIDKATGKNKPTAPDTAKLLKLIPIKATGKDNKKSWADMESSGEAVFRSPSTDKETLGILFHQAKDDFTADVVGTLRDIRFLGQALKTTLVPPTPKVKPKVRKAKKQQVPVPAPVIVEVPVEEDDTYEKGLFSYICSDNRIRTHIFQTLETGRFASARPNLMALSKKREADFKRILGDQYLFPLRAIFVASPGHVFIEADYIGAELAGVAWLSGDSSMIDHVARAQLSETDPNYYDIHSAIAVSAFKLNCAPTKAGLKSINKSQLRIAAKNVVFGYLYGRGAQAIARQAKEEGITITVAEAQALINGLTALYPMLPAYFDACRMRPTEPGWECNSFGRLRRFRPAMDMKVAGEQERQAMNFGIQSLIADAMSRALDHLYFRREKYGLHYKITLQIHDAVILEVPIPEIEQVYDKVIPECLSNLVPIWPTNLSGILINNRGPYYLATDREVCLRWGEKLYIDECIKLGIPERFGSERK